MELLKSPFLNDPSSLVARAFELLYPDKKYEAVLVEKIENPEGMQMVGCTTYPDDGNIPLVEVAAHIPAQAVPEILAHELAHVAVPGDEHGPAWHEAFERIYAKYNELAMARFSESPEEDTPNHNTEEKDAETRPRIVLGKVVGTDWPIEGHILRFTQWSYDNYGSYHLYDWDPESDDAVMRTVYQTEKEAGLCSCDTLEEFKKMWLAQEWEPEGSFRIDPEQIEELEVIREKGET